MKEQKYFIVLVQDIGEVYEYEFDDLAQAQYLMSIEMLPCSLWECNWKTGSRRQLCSQPAA